MVNKFLITIELASIPFKERQTRATPRTCTHQKTPKRSTEKHKTNKTTEEPCQRPPQLISSQMKEKV